MKVWVGPTGRISEGHVLDVSRVPFERALRDYDSLLYVKWNPTKLRGWGCWEIRRRPERNVALVSEVFEGNTYTLVGPKEIDLVNHVLDVAFLNYSQLNKIKSMDSWTRDGHRGQNFVANMERREEESRQEAQKKADENTRYVARQFKKEIKDFKELVASGLNPAQIANYWDKK